MTERKPILPKKDITAEAQEKALEQLQRQDKKKAIHRTTFDFPEFLFDKMKAEIEETGQTMKGFIVGLVRDHFTRKEKQ